MNYRKQDKFRLEGSGDSEQVSERLCRAESLAQDDGVPIDQFIATALAEKVAVLDADSYIRERASRGSREKFERVLSKVPDVEPEDRDRLSPHNAI